MKLSYLSYPWKIILDCFVWSVDAHPSISPSIIRQKTHWCSACPACQSLAGGWFCNSWAAGKQLEACLSAYLLHIFIQYVAVGSISHMCIWAQPSRGPGFLLPCNPIVAACHSAVHWISHEQIHYCFDLHGPGWPYLIGSHKLSKGQPWLVLR